MQWAEVVRVHGGQAGVSVRIGRVSSLLVAKGSGHENQVIGDELVYAVPNRSSYRAALAALHESAAAGSSFRVFVTPVQPPAPPLVARSYSTLEFTPEVLHGDEDEEVDASRGARRGR